MKRKATFRLLFMFFFLFTGLVKADSIETITFAPPTNDDCVNATTLTVNADYLCSTVTPGTLVGATASTVATGMNSCPSTGVKANDDVWFKFVATETTHRVVLKNILGNITDLYMITYDAGATVDCSTMTAINCSDSETNNLTGLAIGNTYIIRVYSNSTATGATTTFDVCVGSMPGVPSNDDCANAIVITGMNHTAIYDGTSTTNNSGFITPAGCAGMNDGVWFKVTGADDGGLINITVEPTSWDAGIAVYTGSCGAFTCVESANAGPIDVVEALSFSTIKDVEYYINIAYPSGSNDLPEGSFNLTIDQTLSINKIKAKGFTYYPNPVKNVLKMSANEPIEQVVLYSILGKEIKRIQQNDLNAELNLYGLPAGTYFVKAVIGNTSGAFKILKK